MIAIMILRTVVRERCAGKDHAIFGVKLPDSLGDLGFMVLDTMTCNWRNK